MPSPTLPEYVGGSISCISEYSATFLGDHIKRRLGADDFAANTTAAATLGDVEQRPGIYVKSTVYIVAVEICNSICFLRRHKRNQQKADYDRDILLLLMKTQLTSLTIMIIITILQARLLI